MNVSIFGNEWYERRLSNEREDLSARACSQDAKAIASAILFAGTAIAEAIDGSFRHEDTNVANALGEIAKEISIACDEDGPFGKARGNTGVNEAIVAVGISPNVSDSNGEPANLVDAISNLANGMFALRNAITPNAAPGTDATGGVIASATEAIMGVCSGLVRIADSIENRNQ